MGTKPGLGKSCKHEARHPVSRPLCVGRACAAVLLACLFLAGGVLSAPEASADEENPSSEGSLLVQQALGHLVHDLSDVRPALVKIDAALAAPDQAGVSVAELQQAKANPPVGARSLIIKKMAKPLAVQAERLSGTPPTKELLCAYPQQ